MTPTLAFERYIKSCAYSNDPTERLNNQHKQIIAELQECVTREALKEEIANNILEKLSLLFDSEKAIQEIDGLEKAINKLGQ